MGSENPLSFPASYLPWQRRPKGRHFPRRYELGPIGTYAYTLATLQPEYHRALISPMERRTKAARETC
jgi:hypothetical protein